MDGIIDTIDNLAVVFFSIEYILRLIVCPRYQNHKMIMMTMTIKIVMVMVIMMMMMMMIMMMIIPDKIKAARDDNNESD